MHRTFRQSKAKVKPISMDFLRWGSSRPQRHDSAKLSENSEKRWFHTPPTVWGFYAFPRGFVCWDLLETGNPYRLYKSNRLHWIKDADGKRIKYDYDVMGSFYDNHHHKRGALDIRLRKINGLKSNYAYIREWDSDDKNHGFAYTYGNPNKFKFSGDIWHHLETFTYTVMERESEDGWRLIDGSEVTKKIRIVGESDIIDRSGTWVKTSMRTYRKALKKYNDYLRHYAFINVGASHSVLQRRRKYKCIAGMIGGEEYAYFEVYIEKL